MPIEYLCVQCYECKTFQVQQAKKKPQFVCAICHSKQSIRKVCEAYTRHCWIHLNTFCLPSSNRFALSATRLQTYAMWYRHSICSDATWRRSHQPNHPNPKPTRKTPVHPVHHPTPTMTYGVNFSSLKTHVMHPQMMSVQQSGAPLQQHNGPSQQRAGSQHDAPPSSAEYLNLTTMARGILWVGTPIHTATTAIECPLFEAHRWWPCPLWGHAQLALHHKQGPGMQGLQYLVLQNSRQ